MGVVLGRVAWERLVWAGGGWMQGDMGLFLLSAFVVCCVNASTEFFCFLMCFSSCYTVLWAKPVHLRFHYKVRFITFGQNPVCVKTVPGCLASRGYSEAELAG